MSDSPVSPTVAPAAAPFRATVLGYPRIGRRRELKFALESYWAGRTDAAALHQVAGALRAQSWRDLSAAGLDSIPVNTSSYYDQVLDTAILLGAIPSRFKTQTPGLDTYFAMARGADGVTALELTKWFDTNYHYLVPEIAADTVFALDPAKVLGEVEQALALGLPARPVLLGPVTFLLLSKSVETGELGGSLPGRLDEVLPLYADLLSQLAERGVGWVQLDEPAFVADRSEAELAALGRAYDYLVAATNRPAILVASYFGGLGSALPVLADAHVDGLAVDLVSDPDADLTGVGFVVAGVVDGRNVWRTDLDRALSRLQALPGPVAVSTSCSLQHVPYSLAPETALDPSLLGYLAFADEKVAEVVALAGLLADPVGNSAALDQSRKALELRAVSAADPAVARRLADLTDSDYRRGPAAARADEQRAALQLPVLPTTTIGSFPQTRAIRSARTAWVRGELDLAGYTARMRAQIAEVVALQEQLGLDVLVHGEPERNDMVQYFAEQLAGFAVTANGWVQSYGSRCVRPPILFGDVSRPAPMTVDWAQYAQSLTSKPMKGMLTGPVTILAWSFVRDDQPLGDTARQVALAIRDETLDLERAGIGVIQVDEPALRELLPLRAVDRTAYLEWAVGSFRLATSGVADATSVHTHLCYSEFGDVIHAIDDLDADVTSIEAARSKMEVLDDLAAVGFARGVGPGVYDIHSPRVPSVQEIDESLTLALDSVPATRLWVNPDCGLKTRQPGEVAAALTNLVAATVSVRAALAGR